MLIVLLHAGVHNMFLVAPNEIMCLLTPDVIMCFIAYLCPIRGKSYASACNSSAGVAVSFNSSLH